MKNILLLVVLFYLSFSCGRKPKADNEQPAAIRQKELELKEQS